MNITADQQKILSRAITSSGNNLSKFFRNMEVMKNKKKIISEITSKIRKGAKP